MLNQFVASVLLAAAFSIVWVHTAQAQVPDHPLITEVFQDADGNDGPAGRLPGNPHQEFIEIYLPLSSDLVAGLNKDALNLSFLEIEGDNSSTGLGRANYRIDLPTFDLDPTNGLTPGAVARPPSGVVVLGWVDYVGGDPPTGLAGTPSTRVGLVNGGITSASEYTFVAINGAQFDGTTNFPLPVTVSHQDPSFPANPMTGVSYASSGEIEQGSAAYLLVNRDDPGYSEICAFNDPGPCNSAAQLPAGSVLQTSSLLDGFATNDDNQFDPTQQPTPIGGGIDLDLVLPAFGAFSLLVSQLAEDLHGHARLFLDSVKTTEDGSSGNEDPASDSLLYRTISNSGAVEPTPGSVHLSTSPAELQLGSPSAQFFEVLADTVARPAMSASNVGGNFGMNVVTAPGASSNPSFITFSDRASAFPAVGQVAIHPDLRVETFAGAPGGHVETITVQVDASAASGGDPLVVNASDSVEATFTVFEPTTGMDADNQPFQATTLLAVQVLPDLPGVANELLASSFGQHVAANLGGAVDDDRGLGNQMIDPTTDFSDPIVVTALVTQLPTLPIEFIEIPGPAGRPSLVETVLLSAEVQSGKTSYDNSFNAGQTLLQAKEFTIAETPTRSNGFAPSEEIHYADALGEPGAPNSGLSNVVTRRGFELALVESNLGPTGFRESGATDDFGVILQAGQLDPGSPLVTGEFIFLSFSGGLEGADIDTLDVPPHNGLLSIIYLDLDPLKTILGVDTVTRMFLVDGSGNGEIDPIEVFSLVPEPGVVPMYAMSLAAMSLLARVRRRVQP